MALGLLGIGKALLGRKGGGLVSAVGEIADMLHTSTEEEVAAETDRFRAGTERRAVQNQLSLAQVQANIAAAQHKSVFVAGARQFIVWGCGVILFLHYGVLYVATYIIQAANLNPDFTPPPMDLTEMTLILGGLLGIHKVGRSYEKAKGVATTSLSPRQKKERKRWFRSKSR